MSTTSVQSNGVIISRVEAYRALVQIAIVLGAEIVTIIRVHAKKELSPEEYAQLVNEWDLDVRMTANDAGIQPAPNDPLPVAPLSDATGHP